MLHLRHTLALVVLAFVLVAVPVAAQESDEPEPPTPDLLSVLADLGVGRIQQTQADPPQSVDPSLDGGSPGIEVLAAATIAGPLGLFDLDGGGFNMATDLFGDPRLRPAVAAPAERNVPVAFGLPGGPQGTVVLPLNDAFFSSWLVFTLLEVSMLPSMVEGEVEVGLYASLPNLTPIGPVEGVNLPGVGATTGSSIVSGTVNEIRSGFIQTNGTPAPELFASGHAVSEMTVDDRYYVGFLTENPATSFTAIASTGIPGDVFSYSWQATPLSLEVTEVTEADLQSSADDLQARYEAAIDVSVDGTAEADAPDASLIQDDPAADPVEFTDESDSPEVDAQADGDESAAAGDVDPVAAEETAADQTASANSEAVTEEAVIVNEPEGEADPGFEWTLVLAGTFVIGGVSYFFYRWSQTKKEPAPVTETRDLVYDPATSRDPDGELAYLRQVIARAEPNPLAVDDGFVPLRPVDFFSEEDPNGRAVPDPLRLYVVGGVKAGDGPGAKLVLGHQGAAMFQGLTLPRPKQASDFFVLEAEPATGRVYRRWLPVNAVVEEEITPMSMGHEGDFLS